MVLHSRQEKIYNKQKPLEKSKKIVFVSECLLNQNIRAYGVKNTKGSGPVAEIMDELVSSDVGINVVPCPEMEYEGLKRTACGKSRYETPEYRKICADLAKETIDRYKMYLNDGYDVSGFICINGSPSCGIDFCALGGGKGWGNEPGIFIEECIAELKKNNLDLNFIGAEMFHMNKTLKKIRDVIYD